MLTPHRSVRTKVLPMAEGRGPSTESRREKGIPPRPDRSVEPSTSLLITFTVFQTPREDCEKVESSPYLKENNLGFIQGTGDSQTLQHSLQNGQCGTRTPASFEVNTRLYKLTVCGFLDHNLHCHDHIQQLKCIFIKMEILSPLSSFSRTLIFSQSGTVFSQSTTVPGHWKS